MLTISITFFSRAPIDEQKANYETGNRRQDGVDYLFSIGYGSIEGLRFYGISSKRWSVLEVSTVAVHEICSGTRG